MNPMRAQFLALCLFVSPAAAAEDAQRMARISEEVGEALKAGPETGKAKADEVFSAVGGKGAATVRGREGAKAAPRFTANAAKTAASATALVPPPAPQKKPYAMSAMSKQLMAGAGSQVFFGILFGHPYLVYGGFATGAAAVGVYLLDRNQQTQAQKDEMIDTLMSAAGTQIFFGALLYKPLILTGLATGAAAVGLYVYDGLSAERQQKVAETLAAKK